MTILWPVMLEMFMPNTIEISLSFSKLLSVKSWTVLSFFVHFNADFMF